MTSARGRRTSNASSSSNHTTSKGVSSSSSSNDNRSTSNHHQPQQRQRSSSQQHSSQRGGYHHAPSKKVSMVAKPNVQILGVPKIMTQQHKQQPPVILTKNEVVHDQAKPTILARGGVEQQQTASPLLLKQEIAKSPIDTTATSTTTASVDLPSSPTAQQQQQQSPNLKLLRRNTPSPSPKNLLDKLNEVTEQPVIKFMNQNWEILTDRLSKMLIQKPEATGPNEFYVIGVFGGRNTGKSTLCNILAGNSIIHPFEIAGANELIGCERKTRGIDLYLTNDRVFILDCEALFGDSSESEPEMTSLHLGLFLYSICHVLIIPHTELYPDSHLIRYVRTLENLKKGIPDQFQKVGPKIIFVANEQDKSSIALSSIHGFDTCSVSHNPDEEAMRLFRESVFRGVDRKFRGGEKDWLVACGKNWEMIRKNYFFGEYIRTVQRIYISS